jgi:peroxiredoxin
MSTVSLFDFTLPDVDGRMVSLYDYAGAKGVLLVFTCNHCPYAIAYEKRIEALNQDFAPQGFPLIAISSNDPVSYPQDAPEKMKARALERGFTFPYLFDATQEVARNYEAVCTPHAFVLHRVGMNWELCYKGAIDDNWQYPARVQRTYLADKVRALLQNEALAYEETQAAGCSIKWRRS